MAHTVDTWFERDRAQVTVWREDEGDGHEAPIAVEVVSWWDDDVFELVEDGFLDPRDWQGSAIAYAEQLGMIGGAA